MIYKVFYKYEEDEKPHFRFYNALSSSVARSMFQETCDHGSLKGADIKLINVRKINSEEKIKSEY